MSENLPKRVTCFEEQGISIIGISSGRDHSLFLSDSGQAFGSGSNAQGQLGLALN
jgi:alpha-tubulin suppressor-like RCC1 family protein